MKTHKNTLFICLSLLAVLLSQAAYAQTVVVNTGWSGRLNDSDLDGVPSGGVFDTGATFLNGLLGTGYGKADAKFDTIHATGLDSFDFGSAEISFYLYNKQNVGDTSLLQTVNVILYTSTVTDGASMADWSPSYSPATTDIATFTAVLTPSSATGQFYTISGAELNAAIASVFTEITTTQQLGIRFEFATYPTSTDGNNHFYSLQGFAATTEARRPTITFTAIPEPSTLGAGFGAAGLLVVCLAGRYLRRK